MDEVQKELNAKANPEKAKILAGFFKTNKGEYGEGDKFLGITVPEVRKTADKFSGISFSEIGSLLESELHEERLCGLLILVHRFMKGSSEEKEKIYKYYMENTKFINNWDLVDVSADKILGAYLMGREKNTLYRLAKSGNIWERRIAIVSTFHFIRKNSFNDTFKIAEILLHDRHDLIHKAVGWMLRETGKRDENAEESFLKKHYKEMPRTMLRYAVERFPEKKRKSYTKGTA